MGQSDYPQEWLLITADCGGKQLSQSLVEMGTATTGN